MCPVCSQEWGDDVEVCPNDGVALVQLETGNGAGGSGLVGQVVDGRYKIERIVGKGGMGTVYACRHVVVGKEFAIKVLRPGIERSEEVLQRFIREAQAANAIRSRHICEMTDFGQLKGHGGAFYVVMELLVGDSLTKRLRNEDLDRSGLLHIFEQVAQTLEKAHQAGILHRDLKPDNVVIVEDDGDPTFVKLVDFGIAKMMHAAAGELTETGVILGTPYYMSPEQARGEELDARTDIYSLGVMLYRAFTGRLPFVADTAMGVLTRHITEKPQTPSKLVEIDRPLERLILRCMEKKPIDRFQTMTEVAEAIRSLPPFEGSVADTGSDDMRSTRDERTSVPSESPTPASLPAASSDRLPTHPSAEAWPPPSGDPSGVSEPRTRPSIPAPVPPPPGRPSAVPPSFASPSSWSPRSSESYYADHAATDRGLSASNLPPPNEEAAARSRRTTALGAVAMVSVVALTAIAIAVVDRNDPVPPAPAAPPPLPADPPEDEPTPPLPPPVKAGVTPPATGPTAKAPPSATASTAAPGRRWRPPPRKTPPAKTKTPPRGKAPSPQPPSTKKEYNDGVRSPFD